MIGIKAVMYSPNILRTNGFQKKIACTVMLYGYSQNKEHQNSAWMPTTAPVLRKILLKSKRLSFSSTSRVRSLASATPDAAKCDARSTTSARCSGSKQGLGP